ncbi:hypothetical protein FE257_001829 [Aspergillus nanangensis]|uniref:Uncharacterized protein n=1 Tax=Aspergillus nanangensis TaxID=2582783 RepID=A0AAD4CEK2_ASPNN|nr:hypothetical protein FE257_001829 [Aspergillus nanangensis]
MTVCQPVRNGPYHHVHESRSARSWASEHSLHPAAQAVQSHPHKRQGTSADQMPTYELLQEVDWRIIRAALRARDFMRHGGLVRLSGVLYQETGGHILVLSVLQYNFDQVDNVGSMRGLRYPKSLRRIVGLMARCI